ncbi:MAG: bacterial Ig-like domain-containing protein [Treponema sp.]|nr:bacterial Ig-like domain-containing protein [Treponema sp.]
MKNSIKTLAIIAITAIITLGMAACASLTIVSVDWDSLKGPSKVRQYYNVSTTEVSVYANYKDESRKEVIFFSTAHDRDKTGIQTVTVTISGQGTGTFQTEVMELTGIRVDRSPTKTTYTEGEGADLAGIRVMGSWRDFPDAEISASQVTVTSFNSGSAGSNRLVTIDYKGKTATFPVTVIAAAPAPTTTTTPGTQQPTQPVQTGYNPSPNQPSPLGSWERSYRFSSSYLTTTVTFNSNGTGIQATRNRETGGGFDLDFTWTASGNKITFNFSNGNVSVCVYSISGPTFTMAPEGTNNIETFTRK